MDRGKAPSNKVVNTFHSLSSFPTSSPSLWTRQQCNHNSYTWLYIQRTLYFFILPSFFIFHCFPQCLFFSGDDLSLWPGPLGLLHVSHSHLWLPRATIFAAWQRVQPMADMVFFLVLFHFMFSSRLYPFPFIWRATREKIYNALLSQRRLCYRLFYIYASIIIIITRMYHFFTKQSKVKNGISLSWTRMPDFLARLAAEAVAVFFFSSSSSSLFRWSLVFCWMCAKWDSEKKIKHPCYIQPLLGKVVKLFSC